MDKNLNPLIVFAGDWDEYARWVGKHDYTIADAKYLWEQSQLPLGDFNFVETGAYGQNKAWKHMRDLYGFTERERDVYHSELIGFIKENYPEARERTHRPNIVPFTMDIVQCPHKQCRLGQKIDSCVSSLHVENCRIHNENAKVDMVTVGSKNHVVLGKVGKCSCGKIYYSLKLVVNKTPNKSAMISQIASASIFSFKDVEEVYLQTNDLLRTEHMLQLMAVSGLSYRDIIAPQQFSMSFEGTWKHNFRLRYIWHLVKWHTFWRWYYGWKFRGCEKDSNR